MGPGVGGMSVWEIIKQRDSTIAVPAKEIPARLVSALFNGDKMTNPESAKTGMDTIYPIIPMAGIMRFLPIFFKILSVLFKCRGTDRMKFTTCKCRL